MWGGKGGSTAELVSTVHVCIHILVDTDMDCTYRRCTCTAVNGAPICLKVWDGCRWESNSDLVNCMLLHNLCSRRCLLVLILCYCNLHDFDSRLWCSNWRHSVQLGGGVLILEPGTHLEDGM